MQPSRIDCHLVVELTSHTGCDGIRFTGALQRVESFQYGSIPAESSFKNNLILRVAPTFPVQLVQRQSDVEQTIPIPKHPRDFPVQKSRKLTNQD